MSDHHIRDFWQSKRSKAGLVERRALEPICTALLTHNEKLAVQNCQKALRIKPYNPPVQTLFAVCLLRQGQLKNALAVAQEVAADTKGGGKALADASILCLLSWIFDQNNKGKEAAEMWETATQKHPSNMDISLESVNYFIKIGAFRAIEKVCRRVIDAKEAVLLNAHEHFLWTYITSVVIQADDLSNPKAKIRVTTPASQTSPETIYKSLQDCLGYFNVEAFTPVGQPFAPSAPIPVDVTACRNPHTFYLLVKVLKHLAEAPESVRDIVDSQAAKSQLLLHLSMPFGLQYAQKDLTVELFVRETLLKLGGESQWTLLGLMMEKKLADGDRNWSTILTLIQASYGWATGSTEVPTKRTEITEAMEPAVPGNWWNKEESECSDSPGIGRLVRAKCLLERLGSDEGFSKKDRGFTLGLLKMASWYPTRIQSNFPDLVILYLKRHANKACCFSDLREYLALLDESGRHGVQAWLDTTYNSEDISIESLQAMECSMTAEKVRRYLQGRFGSVEEELQRGHRLAKAYFASLHFGKALIATDLQPNDEFALLSAQCYIGAWQQSQNSSQYLELAIAILEFAIRKSKYRFQIRVLLIRLYQIAGAPNMMLKHYKLMDLKQIQFDTLGHWALERGTTFFAPPDAGKQGAPIIIDGDISSLSETLRTTLAWYRKADDETTYSVQQAWASNAYYLLEDYTAFKDRLACSLSQASIALDIVAIDNMHAANPAENMATRIEAVRELLLPIIQEEAELNDNRDYSILPNYQPSEEASVISQTQFAPRTNTFWVKRLAKLYLAFLEGSPNEQGAEGTSSDNEPFTEHEEKLFQWAIPVLQWLSGKEAKIEDAKVLQFMKECHADLVQSNVNGSLWPLYHTAQLALEAYSLLDLAFAVKSADPGDFKGIKQFKQIRQDSKGTMKAISSRLKQLNEDLARKYKARTKLEPLLPLKQFEQVSEDFLFDVATQLLESRKAGLLQLANAITKRTAGP